MKNMRRHPRCSFLSGDVISHGFFRLGEEDKDAQPSRTKANRIGIVLNSFYGCSNRNNGQYCPGCKGQVEVHWQNGDYDECICAVTLFFLDDLKDIALNAPGYPLAEVAAARAG